MVSASTSNMIVAISVVALLVFVRAMRKVLRCGEWSRTATLAAVIAACTHISVDVFVTYLGVWNKTDSASVDAAPWVWPEQWHQVWRGLNLLLGLLAVAVFFVRSRRGQVPVDVPAALLAVVAIVSFLSSLLHGDNPFRPISLVYLALLIACTVAPRGLGIHVGIGTFCVFIALASGFTFLPFVGSGDFGVLPCTSTKCGILDFIYVGIRGNENASAILLALGMPFVYIAFRSWEGVVLCTYLLGVILITGSRSGVIAGVLTFVALMVLRPDFRRPAPELGRVRLLYSILVAAFVVGMVLPFMRQEPSAFTGRAFLWSLAREALTDPANLWYGTGVFSTERLRESGLTSIYAYSVHNQWLQVLFSTGLIGFVLFLAALALMLWNSRGTYSLVLGSVLIPVFVLSVTERPWLIDSTDFAVWAVPAALLCYPAVRGSGITTRSPQSETATDQRLDDAVDSDRDA